MEKQSASFQLRKLQSDKGVAGLTILLSVIAMIFIIGFLVMVFVIISGGLTPDVRTVTDVTVTDESGAFINQTTYTVDGASTLYNPRNFVITSARNASTGIIQAGNYTINASGTVFNATAQTWTNVFLNYTYTYDANNTATESISDTAVSIAGVTTWFPIIITITVMVALILLTVIIIVAIRSSGILAGGQ